MTEEQMRRLRELLSKYDGIEALRDRYVLRSFPGIGGDLAVAQERLVDQLSELDREIMGVEK